MSDAENSPSSLRRLTSEEVEALVEGSTVVDEQGREKEIRQLDDELCFGCHSY